MPIRAVIGDAAEHHETSLGQLLLDNADELIERWYRRWRAATQAKHLPEATLKDLVPLQLRVIGKALQTGSYRGEQHPADLWQKAHWRLAPEERVSQRIAIDELVQEYWLLVSTVRDWIVEKRFVVLVDEYAYFYEAVFALIAESVRRYASFQAEEVSHERAEYLAGLAHQMRGPLSVLTMGIARVEAGAARPELLAAMRRSIARLTKQVTDVMRLERYQEGELPVDLELVYPGGIIDDIVLGVQDEAARKHLAVEVRADRSVQMHADPELVEDALGNVIHNAVKYTSSGFVRIEMEQHDHDIEFRVVDSGPGIDEKRLPELFRPGQSSARGGAGIGLAVAQRAVRAQGGTIGVESKLGAGSTFSITLPKRVQSCD